MSAGRWRSLTSNSVISSCSPIAETSSRNLRHSRCSVPSADGTEQREWRKFLDEVSAMGLQLLITEFDVNDRHLPADIAARDAGVAAAARDYLDLSFSYPNLGDF